MNHVESFCYGFGCNVILLRRRFHPDHYYLTEHGLSFFYPMYALGPAAEGIPVFSLPYGDLFSAPGGQKNTPASS